MKILKQVSFFLLELIIFIIFLFNLATLFPIPRLGSIANHYTVPYIRIWLPLLFILFLISVYLAYHHKKFWHILNAILASFSFLIGLYMVISIQTNLNQLGADVSFLKSYQAEDTYGVSVDSVTYSSSKAGDVKLNVYQVDDGKENKPVLIYIHGGGWVAGHRSSHSYYWKSFAKDGYVVVSLDYDLSSKKRHLSDVTESQLTKGFAWVEQNIGQYGGSTDHLFVTGVSAGGNLALELAYKINKGQYKKSLGVELPKVDAVSVLYPVADPKSFYENNDSVKGDIAKSMVMAYLGGRPDQVPKKYAQLTPKNAISDKTPPTLFISGQRDTLVPQEATYDLARQLTKKKIPNKLVIMPYTNHAFDRIDANLGSQAYLKLTKDWFKDYLK
ncbi:alpha/beta hydrolase [Streptococcus catagoni]|uniref:alpha/beta hydrolase n=1 Tax=Streptococcus catagoni TaxID=2654874 RepID=UPI001409A36D|nr:alpha/beta hydrolase [Streptococcus catagoni]